MSLLVHVYDQIPDRHGLHEISEDLLGIYLDLVSYGSTPIGVMLPPNPGNVQVGFGAQVLAPNHADLVNANPWSFAPEIIGDYRVDSWVHITLPPVGWAATWIELQLFRNGTFWRPVDRQVAAATATEVSLHCHSAIDLSLGETASLHLVQGGGGPQPITIQGFADTAIIRARSSVP